MPNTDQGAVKLLDCTLRDGGYYNDWDFSKSLVQEYLRAMCSAGIELVELGFRQMPGDRYLGPHAYTTDEYISTLDVPDGLVIGVMVDAKHLLAGPSPTARVRQLFRPAAESPVDLVRIAANFSELDSVSPDIAHLKDLGYGIGLNLMQIGSRSEAEIAHFGEAATSLGVEVAYFADSFGGIQPADVERIITSLRTTWQGPIGCHMHDNMTFALANTLTAIDAGAAWADGTILGMGRGPGNARTEYLAMELNRRSLGSYDELPLINLVQGSFSALHQEYGWGSNPFYFLSATRGIHPTYIQALTGDGRYGLKEVVTALDALRDGSGSSFSRGKLNSALIPLRQRDTGTYDASGWCAGRDVLIVGPGPAGLERRVEIEDYIRRSDPVVVALNIKPPVDLALVDALVVCHPIRALMDAPLIQDSPVPVFAPKEVLGGGGAGWEAVDIRDFGLNVEPESFSYTSSGCVIPDLEAIAYALALAGAGGARVINLSGFDGFDAGDPRQEVMVNIFTRFAEIPEAPPVVALTRSNYPVVASSIFAPLVDAE